jgi:prolyl 4-hydroxylase
MEAVPPFAGAQRVPNSKLELFIKRDFLDEDDCATIMAMIDARRRPSTIADDITGDPTYRTSETCDLDQGHPLTQVIDWRIADFLGLPTLLGEPMQGQRYAPGQEFKAHTDYFEPEGSDYQTHCAASGQRTWTAMIYLNEPQAGGATRFKTIDKIINGRVNGSTLHQGMKVRAGVKYIITKWFREYPWVG